jgi:polysaccharide biosynthesis protein PslG
MASHLRRFTVAFAVGLVAMACVPLFALAHSTSAAHAAAAAPPGGVNIEGARYSAAEADRQIETVKLLHAKLVRFELAWANFEPNGPGQMEPRTLAYTDRLLADAHAAGIGVIMLVDDTPCWASSAPAEVKRRCRPGRPSQANDWPPENPANYATTVGYLAQRYGDELTAIEVWNEPDQANELYFAGPNKAARYAALLRAAYPAVKQADPNIKVLAGSLVGYNGIFLRALYAAGIKGYYDGLAVHFYSLTLASLRSFRAAEVASGDQTPLWLDEFGWSSCYPRRKLQDEQACVTPQVQARNITNLYRELSGTSYLAAMTLFTLRDSSDQSFGVLSARGGRKPSFGALAGVLGSPFGAVEKVSLELRHSGGRVLASGGGPVGDTLKMEVRVAGALRFRALFTLDRFNRYSIRLPASLGTRGLSARVYQTWLGPASAVEKSI